MNRTYGYCRISTAKQNISRQIRNITRSYPDARIIEETYTGTAVDPILKGVNAFLMSLAEAQIRLAFEQSQKEVDDLRQRTREGIETARRNGKQIGRQPGSQVHRKREADIKEQIRKYSRGFNGSLTDPETMKLIGGISRGTYYKYKAQLR